MNPIIPKTNSAPGAGAPASLYLGELASNRTTGKLYLGCDGGVQEVGGGTVGSQISAFTGNGSATAFSPVEGYSTNDAGSYIVSVGGIDQRPTTDWTISSANSGTITFASAPPTGAPIVVRAFVGTGTTTGDATKLQGRALADTAPTDGQAVVWDSENSTWKPSTVSIGGGTLYDENVIYKDGDIVSCHFINPPFTYGVFVCTASKCQESQGLPITGKIQGVPPPTSFPMAPDPYWGPITFNSGVEGKINEIITWANTAGASITPL